MPPEDDSFSFRYYTLLYGPEVATLIQISPIHYWAEETGQSIEAQLNNAKVDPFHKKFIHEFVAIRSQQIISSTLDPANRETTELEKSERLLAIKEEYDMDILEEKYCDDISTKFLNRWQYHLTHDN